jgi:hypothetical protein
MIGLLAGNDEIAGGCTREGWEMTMTGKWDGT